MGIVGTGLLGASLALALQRAGVKVLLYDLDPEALALACRLTGAISWTPGVALEDPGGSPPDVIAVCVPPAHAGTELFRVSSLYPDATITDVTSVKTMPLLEAETLGADLTRLVGGHPMAGRERGGPASARADLFQGRPWALCPGGRTEPGRLGAIQAMALATGAVPVTLSAVDHDQAVARLSHLPQLLASALAASLSGMPDNLLALAGPGVADMTRLAASPPDLWGEVIPRNS
ncbi:MAG: prephenate dehydrogenase, partial [Mycobacteriales bacterium]